MTRRTALTLVALGLLLGGVWQLGEAAYIHAKALLAQVLLRTAWERTRAGETRVRPWPWADTWPVSRLRVPRLDMDLIVLADSSGRTLAFGPGHLSGSAQPGTSGNTVISAHRDTHFRKIKSIVADDDLYLETADGRRHRYRVRDTRIVDSGKARMVMETDVPMLTLVTCYPFDAVIPGGPLRYVVTAVEVRGPALAGAPGLPGTRASIATPPPPRLFPKSPQSRNNFASWGGSPVDMTTPAMGRTAP